MKQHFFACQFSVRLVCHNMPGVKLIIGNSNRPLFESVAIQATALLRSRGIAVDTIMPCRSSDLVRPPHSATVEKFSNGEIHVDIGENLRGQTVYIMQTEDNHPGYSANDYLMELKLLISTCKLASAVKINVIIPSYFYARQDKKDRPRVPISAKLVATELESAGANRVITIDLHSAQIQGFFNIPVDNLYAIRYMKQRLESLISTSGRPRTDFVLVSPDLGGENRIKSYSAAMRLPFVLASKSRDHTKSSVIETLHIYGDTDCTGRIGILIDDIADTFGTMKSLVDELQKISKFAEFWVAVTHGSLSGPAVERLQSTPSITRMICTNSMDRTEMASRLPQLEIVDISSLFARVIFAIETDSSISALFETAEPPTPLHKVMTPPESPSDPPAFVLE